MAQGPDRRYMTGAQAEAAGVDVGLRSYMLRVYNYMSLGIAFTGAIAMIVAMNPAAVQAISGGLFWVFFLGVLGMGFFAPRLMMTKSVGVAQGCFWAYAGMWGALLGPMFFAYAQMDPMILVRAFLITAATFAGTSLAGYTTKKDLSGLGTFFMMATIGVLIAMLVNVFLIQSTGFELVLSIGVVLLFSAMTAYETQMIKSMYSQGDMGEVQSKKAIFGAFMLYGSFITLFIWILNILGIMRE
ncbi:Bax inhibitor-1/YccA family protein [Rhodovibrio salinarum]|uniref:BAX inhibitor (BI)-1/YccA family protein n=1 Tax=Rhodovibrio salinarum TaxID=1087 RepID=A0A934QGR3_9PROT|nr:Bax inhibitor-1/YccA family protein [Rhodovibrio salinarum]MBK1696706.1 BAX inhibitor (BI)-1/YccA family protein [Rhodovibrio salinarum]